MQATFQKLLSLPTRWFVINETAPARRADLDWLRMLALTSYVWLVFVYNQFYVHAPEPLMVIAVTITGCALGF